MIATVALTLLIATSIWREKLRIPYEPWRNLARHFCGDGGGVGPGPCLWGGQLPQPVLAGGVVGAVWVNGSVAADFCASGQALADDPKIPTWWKKWCQNGATCGLWYCAPGAMRG